ncbi:hypothetical protein F2Q70_00040033 [Brassica cretica]|uniref:Uncharacterized protein n=1 Tax=Brassica cretica TaxID=69181 RepID=A0A8S9K3B8_BRACR|nr:hypothetical protein F2Q70_00040033 [Brassica cretica]
MQRFIYQASPQRRQLSTALTGISATPSVREDIGGNSLLLCNFGLDSLLS